MTGSGMKAPLAALLVLLAAFVFCVLTSTVFGWHPAVTRPAAAACAAGLIACGVWLNWNAGSSDVEDEDERGYRDQMSRLDGTTLPRARFILDQQQATLPGTPYDQGCVRATAGYIAALEASRRGEGQP